MFESDDFDQVLSQLDIPDDFCKTTTKNCDNVKSDGEFEFQHIPTELSYKDNVNQRTYDKNIEAANYEGKRSEDKFVQNNNLLSPIQCKRKIINSHFDSNCKRKFPGPAGLLSGSFKEYKDEENINHIELLSQDIDFSQNPIHRGLFDSTLWKRLLNDVGQWKLKSVETIKTIKRLALTGSLKQRKAQTITAFVECVDRSDMDPLVTLRDLTGNIKCTLHRDAWSYFSTYIIPGHSAVVLYRPTVLTTGGAFKKHYLNITMSNILAIYSSVLDNNQEKSMPNGYEKFVKEDCTIIKMEKEISDENRINNEFDDLDGIFSDEIFE